MIIRVKYLIFVLVFKSWVVVRIGIVIFGFILYFILGVCIFCVVFVIKKFNWIYCIKGEI